jgi:hypothetical protein
MDDPWVRGWREPGEQGADGVAASLGRVNLGGGEEDALDDDSDDSQEMDAESDGTPLDETYDLQHDFENRFYTQKPPASYGTRVPDVEALFAGCFRCLRPAATHGEYRPSP